MSTSSRKLNIDAYKHFFNNDNIDYFKLNETEIKNDSNLSSKKTFIIAINKLIKTSNKEVLFDFNFSEKGYITSITLCYQATDSGKTNPLINVTYNGGNPANALYPLNVFLTQICIKSVSNQVEGKPKKIVSSFVIALLKILPDEVKPTISNYTNAKLWQNGKFTFEYFTKKLDIITAITAATAATAATSSSATSISLTSSSATSSSAKAAAKPVATAATATAATATAATATATAAATSSSAKAATAKPVATAAKGAKSAKSAKSAKGAKGTLSTSFWKKLEEDQVAFYRRSDKKIKVITDIRKIYREVMRIDNYEEEINRLLDNIKSTPLGLLPNTSQTYTEQDIAYIKRKVIQLINKQRINDKKIMPPPAKKPKLNAGGIKKIIRKVFTDINGKKFIRYNDLIINLKFN
jgi:hypothetical protein